MVSRSVPRYLLYALRKSRIILRKEGRSIYSCNKKQNKTKQKNENKNKNINITEEPRKRETSIFVLTSQPNISSLFS